jgi:hypothetical protein
MFARWKVMEGFARRRLDAWKGPKQRTAGSERCGKKWQSPWQAGYALEGVSKRAGLTENQ